MEIHNLYVIVKQQVKNGNLTNHSSKYIVGKEYIFIAFPKENNN